MPLCIPPPDPPVGTPAPTPAPVPVPPAPPPATPAPTPAPAPWQPPPPPPPVLPTPPAQIVLDWTGTGSYLSSVDSPCSFTIPMSWAFVNSAPMDGSTCGLTLKFKNLSPTGGTLNFAVRAADGRLTIYGSAQSVQVPGNGFAVATVTFQIGNGSTDPGSPGAYAVELEDSNGAKVTWNLVMGPGLPPLSPVPAPGTPYGYCPQEFIGAGA